MGKAAPCAKPYPILLDKIATDHATEKAYPTKIPSMTA